MAVLLFYASTFVVEYGEWFRRRDPLVREDYSRLEPARVAAVDTVRRVEELRAVLADARSRKLKVSIAGSRHSQGGHTYTAGGLVLDMRSFNNVLAIDSAGKRITVEAGATWAEVQRAIAPKRLAIKVMQSSNIFTVGGTMSANAHGRDLDVTQMVEVVESFRIMLADGSMVDASRTKNTELFSLAIGGYGMYGVILDATLRLAADEMYEQRSVAMDYHDFPAWFATKVKADTSVVFLLARPSIDPDADSFLKEIIGVTWRRAPAGMHDNYALTEEANVWRDKVFFGISRKSDWAKSLRWALQKKFELGADEARIVSRNNSMRPPLAPLELLSYHSSKNTDIIQEYYVPVENFIPFMDRFRTILVDGRMNVLSATVRYVTANPSTALSYAPARDVFAIIHMSNVPLSAEGQAHARDVTRKLVDAAIENGGTYYLTYQLYPTVQQFHRAYPGAARALERKRFYDPDDIFSSQFYETYGRPVTR